MLTAHNLPPNAVRDRAVYQTNECIWATRPLTKGMIKWASVDVHSLFLLHEKQCGAASDSEAKAGAPPLSLNLDPADPASLTGNPQS